MALSVDQIYLLNCLSYMCPKEVSALSDKMTINDYCQTVLNSSLPNELQDGTFMTKTEIIKTCERIVNDPALRNMSVTSVSYSDSGAVGFVAVSPETSEAVVCFQGSVGDLDWVDNLQGGAVVETAEQRKALEWYRSVDDSLQQYDTITVTGHSKGGNKAKYITLMEETGMIDRCISFDGQGMSDEFMEANAERVAQRQHKIDNYSNEKDFVNILLNDVGERHYIKSDQAASGMEVHSLFSLSDIESIEDNLVPQDSTMQSLDRALNSLIRSLPSEKKESYLVTIGHVMAAVCNAKYGEQYEYGLEDVFGLLNRETFTVVKHIVGHLLTFYAKELIFDQLCDWLQTAFPFLSGIISDIQKTVGRGIGLDQIDEGEDVRIFAAFGNVAGAEKIVVDTEAMYQMAALLRDLGDDLSGCGRQLDTIAGQCMFTIARHLIGIGSLLIRGYSVGLNGTTSMVLHRIASSSEDIAQHCSELARKLQNIAERFEDAESEILGIVQ